jgi:hypothetical protein
MIKKVGIVTWNDSYNYGTNLQAYALFSIIKSMGYDVYMLRYFSLEDYSIKGRLKAYYLRLKYKIKHRPAPSSCGKDPIKMQKIKDFIDQNFLYSFPTKSKSTFLKLIKETDCFITGSDQIWNPFYMNPFYMLSMVDDSTKKVSYASSIGVNNLPASKAPIYKKYLSRFNYLSLREKVGAKIVQELTGKEASVVLDPTLLLSDKEWDMLSNKAVMDGVPCREPYILCYFVGDNMNHWEDVYTIQSEKGIKQIIALPLEENQDKANAYLYETAGPQEFIWLIKNASLVCTDSFHATALCINMKIDFIEFLRFRKDDPKSQNSRMYEILAHYGIMDRFYNVNNKHIYDPMDFTEIHKILKDDRKKSMDYLKNALSS